jgi:hypothetical protein
MSSAEKIANNLAGAALCNVWRIAGQLAQMVRIAAKYDRLSLTEVKNPAQDFQ